MGIEEILVTKNLHFTYTKNQVDKHVIWENHCHASYEMLAVLEGDVTVTLEGRSLHMTKNQVLLIPPLCYHTVTANAKGDYQRITVFFDKAAIPSALQTDFEPMHITPVLCSNTWIDDIRSIFEPAALHYYEPFAESLMVCFFYKYLQHSDSVDSQTDRNQFVDHIISYIDEHLLERITLDDLAKHTARSKSFVCHTFEEQVGTPPRQYILQKRMAYAQMRLRDGHSATAIAVELGYKSYASFWRMYQKYCGINPLKSKPLKNESILRAERSGDGSLSQS